ncbi:MAG: family 10 glycosylhydrolase [Anaerolineae bacterium]|nr:family 10 glycosylhydrolase [Anaerolineae bacterium]
MMRKQFWLLLLGLLLLGVGLTGLAAATQPLDDEINYLPLVQSAPPTATPEPPPLVEFRGLWVSRFDWTLFGQPANPAKIDEIVQNMAAAKFNVIFFQVRGSADAYYIPGPEPWAPRMSGGTLGQAPNPVWDPLAYLIAAAHQHNIQVHAYLNAYPVWDNCTTPPPMVSPTPLYHQLNQLYGTNNGFQWTTSNQVHCSGYIRATPASIFTDDQMIAVATYLVDNYAIDGLHLDNIRYGGQNTSCDPVSINRFGAPCFSAGYANWQRAQVNGTVSRFYNEVILPNPDLWYSAAVWPIHIDKWGWGGSQGYHEYYQDSKGWLAGEYMDSISPMIYPGTYNCPDNSFWTLSRWQTLVADFQAESSGRYLIPGIGTGYCTFAEIESRIAAARAIGTAGHALFSYRDLLVFDYFDDLANGPYAEPALVPEIPWR